MAVPTAPGNRVPWGGHITFDPSIEHQAKPLVTWGFLDVRGSRVEIFVQTWGRTPSRLVFCDGVHYTVGDAMACTETIQPDRGR